MRREASLIACVGLSTAGLFRMFRRALRRGGQEFPFRWKTKLGALGDLREVREPWRERRVFLFGAKGAASSLRAIARTAWRPRFQKVCIVRIRGRARMLSEGNQSRSSAEASTP